MAVTPEIIENNTEHHPGQQDLSIFNSLKLWLNKIESAFKKCFELKNLELATGSGNPELAELIGREIGKQMDRLMEQENESDAIRVFADGERRPIFKKELRRKHIIIIQSFSPPRKEGDSSINDQVVELMIACENARRASSAEITAFMPYMAYARSDKKDMPRVGIGVKAVINGLETNGASRCGALDIHQDQIAGFADVFDIIYSSEFFIPILKKYLNLEKTVIASPDNSDSMAKAWCRRLLGHPRNGRVDKFREKGNGQSQSYGYIGPEVDGMTVVLVDDLIAGGSTIIDAAQILKEEGAQKVMAVAPHGLLLDDALVKIRDSKLDEGWISNSIRQSPDVLNDEITGGKIKIFNIAGFLAEKLVKIHTGESMGID